MTKLKITEWIKDSELITKKTIHCLYKTMLIHGDNYPYRINRNGIENLEKDLNDLIEKYIKTDIRIHFKVLDYDDDDDAWCRARINRDLGVEYIND